MSDLEPIEQVRAVYEGWANGNFHAGQSLIGPDAEWVVGAEFPNHGTYRGQDEVRAMMSDFLSTWEQLTIHAEQLRAFGHRVLVDVQQRGFGAASGVEVEMRAFHLWEFRDGMAARMEVFMDEARALRAARMGQIRT